MRWLQLFFVVGQVASLGARTLPIRRYEAQITPLAITQDRDGLLWLATPGRVLRFDGLHFDPVAAPAGIDLSRVRHLAAGPDGSIWMGSGNGLIQYRAGAFTIRLPGAVTALIVTRAGRLLATVESRSGLFVFMEPGTHPERYRVASPVYVNGEFHEDLNGAVWFGCGVAICSWSDADVKAAAAGTTLGHLPRWPPEARGRSYGEGHSWVDVVGAPDHRIWGRSGLEVLTLQDRRVVRQQELPVKTYGGERPHFFLDRRGRLWIPSRNLNVVEDGAMRAFTELPEEVTAIYQDRQATLWFGLAGKGLAAFPDKAALATFSEPEGISGSVLDLARHARLGLLAATDSGAYCFDEKQQRWRAFGSAAERVALRTLAAGPDGSLLSVPNHGGLLRSAAPFVSARGVPLPAKLNPAGLRRLFADGHGAVWFGAHVGLFRMDAAMHIMPVSLPDAGVHASDLWADSTGRLWVGYEGGVARCIGEECTQVLGPKDGLLDPRIRTIAPGDEEIWVGYRASIAFSRFKRVGGRWIASHFQPAEGFGPPDTHFLRRDRRGWIWRGAEDGVHVSDGKHTEPEDWLHLQFGDRVNADYANMYGFLEEADGSIWIGTQAGAVHLAPPVDWFANARPAVAATAGWEREDLEIHLSHPELAPFQSRLFRYRLLPIDSRWRLSSDGTLRYAKLRGGSYHFQLASGLGNAPLDYDFRVGGRSGLPVLPWILLAAAAAAALLVAVARRWRLAEKASEEKDYWREKRLFLKAREVDDWSGRLLDDRFLLERCIGGGSFAAVYRALDQTNHGKPVAVKLLHTFRDHEQWRRRRFADEVSSLQTVSHPGIVRIQCVGEAVPGRPYLVMEFLDGVTLRALIASGPLNYERSARLLQQIGDALAAAHRAGILHRDLKPENVMVSDAGLPGESVKLIDFGIANIQAERASSHSTCLAGSPGYLAPERWIGLETCASDIYSLAAIAWEMLSGEPYQHGGDAPRATLPETVAGFLTAALAYDPAHRPQDAQGFAGELAGRLLECSRKLVPDSRR